MAFSGVLQVDGYAAYGSLARVQQPVEKICLAFCLAYAKRKFVDVHKRTKSPFNIALSGIASGRSFFSLAFSSSSAFSRLALGRRTWTYACKRSLFLHYLNNLLFREPAAFHKPVSLRQILLQNGYIPGEAADRRVVRYRCVGTTS
jgi:hypothetical protein